MNINIYTPADTVCQYLQYMGTYTNNYKGMNANKRVKIFAYMDMNMKL